MRLKEAFGLSHSAGGAGALALAAKERMATVWPADMKRWACEERGEVLKIEAKIATLMSDPQGTSIQLKGAPKPVRRMCHALAEFYGMKARSDDDFDPRGKTMRIIKALDATAPWPLLSDAHRFERDYPWLVEAAVRSKHEAEAGRAAATREPPDPATCLLVAGVNDLILESEVRDIVAEFAEAGEVVAMWPYEPQGALREDGCHYALELCDATVALRVKAAMVGAEIPVPFEVQFWPTMRADALRSRPEASNDSWTETEGTGDVGSSLESPSASPPDGGGGDCIGIGSGGGGDGYADLETWELLDSNEALSPPPDSATGGDRTLTDAASSTPAE